MRSRSRWTALTLVIGGLGVASLMAVALLSGPRPVAPEASASARPSSFAFDPSRTFPMRTESPPPPPRTTPCVLPDALPAPEQPGVIPETTGDGALLFSSYSEFEVISDDRVRPVGAARGLWYRPAGGAKSRLLFASADGRVVPLALSRDARTAAIWWLPETRAEDELQCAQGIYVLSTDGADSRLVRTGDWRWYDPYNGDFAYRIPEASFSPNGEWLALREKERIQVYGPRPAERPVEHVGACSDFTWSMQSLFVAGCDEMTTAWRSLSFPGKTGIPEHLQTWSEALPLPPDAPGLRCGGDQPWGRAIGLTEDNAIRVLRFYGHPEGACSNGKFMYSATTFDGLSVTGTTVWGSMGFIVDGGYDGNGEYDTLTRLSADASWAYVQGAYGGAAVLDIDTGGSTPARRLGEAVGTPVGTRSLFGSRPDPDRKGIVIWTLDSKGVRREFASIAWPDGVSDDHGVIDVVGIQVAPRP